MKTPIAIACLTLVLVAGAAWAAPDGVWKDVPEPVFNYYVQTYENDSMLVIVAAGLERFWVFLDTDFTDGFGPAADLSGAPNELEIVFPDDDNAEATLTFEGQEPRHYTIARTARAPSGEVEGRVKPVGPPNGSLVSTPVLIEWTAVSEATGYEFELADDSEFNNITFSCPCHQTSVTMSSLGDGVHYWHVRAELPDGYGPWSETWSFVTGSP